MTGTGIILTCRDFIARRTLRFLQPVTEATNYKNLEKKYLAKINSRFDQSTSLSLVYYTVTFFSFYFKNLSSFSSQFLCLILNVTHQRLTDLTSAGLSLQGNS
jgi:hypothetical protein